MALKIWICGVVLFATLAAAAGLATAQTPGEDERRARYGIFANTLRPERFLKELPLALKWLNSIDPLERRRAAQIFSAAGLLDAIPLLVPRILEDPDPMASLDAALALERLVSSHELKRRDPKIPDRIVLLPRGPGHLDLRPLAWVVERMLADPDEHPSRASYAATMAGYIGLPELEPGLKHSLASRHPAVVNSAKRALSLIGSKIEEDSLAAPRDPVRMKSWIEIPLGPSAPHRKLLETELRELKLRYSATDKDIQTRGWRRILSRDAEKLFPTHSFFFLEYNEVARRPGETRVHLAGGLALILAVSADRKTHRFQGSGNYVTYGDFLAARKIPVRTRMDALAVWAAFRAIHCKQWPEGECTRLEEGAVWHLGRHVIRDMTYYYELILDDERIATSGSLRAVQSK